MNEASESVSSEAEREGSWSCASLVNFGMTISGPRENRRVSSQLGDSSWCGPRLDLRTNEEGMSSQVWMKESISIERPKTWTRYQRRTVLNPNIASSSDPQRTPKMLVTKKKRADAGAIHHPTSMLRICSFETTMGTMVKSACT